MVSWDNIDLLIIIFRLQTCNLSLCPFAAHSWTDISDDCFAVLDALCRDDVGLDMFTSAISE